jgi:imidazolonepropionase-like amidohydrolase
VRLCLALCLLALPACGARGPCGVASTSATGGETGNHTGDAADGGEAGATTGSVSIRAVTVVGGASDGLVVDVIAVDGVITAMGEGLAGADAWDGEGRFLAPAFIDSHVHLAYLPQVEEMAAGGVAAAIDLAAPLDFLAADHSPLRVLASGPMITAVGGYPTRSWGSDGYGLECSDAEDAAAGVSQLHAKGARLIKLPITSAPVLDDDALRAAADAAHTLGLRVVSHAMSDDEAAQARSVGVDALAHTPTASLESATVGAWSDGAVISTLRAFGGSATTVDNLRALREAGATVLYGTDFGNTRTAGIDATELSLLVEAGLSPAEVMAAGTSAPAAWWGLDGPGGLGEVAVGRAASFLLLERDPRDGVDAWEAVDAVFVDGLQR